MPEVIVNLLAVFVATVAGMMAGALWYGPLFGKAWMKEVNIDPAKLKSDQMKKAYLLTGLATFIQAIILAGLMSLTGMQTASGGIIVGLLGGVGFTATTKAKLEKTSHENKFEKNSRTLLLHSTNKGAS